MVTQPIPHVDLADPDQDPSDAELAALMRAMAEEAKAKAQAQQQTRLARIARASGEVAARFGVAGKPAALT
ncbi:MAG: hypothetical protein LCH73_12205 [Proteobacteria bacterium]|nr:hypothetical protein [Pseudomonadota bacterium]